MFCFFFPFLPSPFIYPQSALDALRHRVCISISPSPMAPASFPLELKGWARPSLRSSPRSRP